MPYESLRGKTALITGAAKRIGRQIALTLVDHGVNLVIHYNRSADESREVCQEVQRRGGKAWTVQGDFNAPRLAEPLFEHARQEAGGPIELLVNNASIFPVDKLADITLEGLHRNTVINAWVPFCLSRAFARQTQRGSIVNLLDSRVWGYDWTHVGYILSKHVLTALTFMCALEFAPGITVNGVAPGLILPPPGKDQSYLDRLIHTVPLQRHGDPQDVADAVAFLLGSDFMTGEVIFVDGGRHLKEYDHGSHSH